MSSPFYVTEPDAEINIRMSATGFGARPATTVIDCFQKTLALHGARNAMALKRPAQADVRPTEWQYWTYTDYYKDCLAFAKSLLSLNVGRYKIINIIGFNSPEWFIASIGCMFVGCIASGVYTSNTSDACQYILEHSKGEILVCEDNKQLKKYASRSKADLKNLKAIVVWAEDPEESLVQKLAAMSVPVYAWVAFLKLGETVPQSSVDERSACVKPGNCASLIYTSGTTGPPKAVMLSHDNITWTATNVCETLKLNSNDRVVSYLPLSHVAAQITDIYAILILGACTYFCQPDALKGTLTITMKEVHPTFFFAVPRVWEKIAEKMIQIGRSTTGAKKSIAAWAKALGARHVRRMQFGDKKGQPFSYKLARSLVLSPIKAALGLDQCTNCFTGAAPIAPETLTYFASLDIPIFELFGQSECTGPHSINFKYFWKLGTCGRPLQGTVTKLGPHTGELCYKGRHIFMGYMYMEEKTKETIDDEGFLHSGDVAVLDEDNDPAIPAPSGFLKITGRIKELIITAGGENVPPVLIENEMKAQMPAVSNVMVIGDRRKFLSQILALKVEVDPETGAPTDTLAPDSLFTGGEIGSKAKTYSEAMQDPLWRTYIDQGVKKANAQTTSNAQVVQKWIWLPVDFSETAGDLTPTLKLKRSVVAGKYVTLIESMYED